MTGQTPETVIDQVTLNEQDPKALAYALSAAIKRVFGPISSWYTVNRVCRDLDGLELGNPIPNRRGG